MISLFPLLPVFLDLAGRGVVLLASDAVCLRLGRQLLEAGANVAIVDPDAGEAAAQLASARVVKRRWRKGDFHGVALVVAGAGEPRARRAQMAAKAENAIFLMLNAPDWSDIALGEGEALGPVALALAAPGLPAALNQALLARLAEAAPPHLAGFFEAAALSGARADDAEFWRAALHDALTAAPADWRRWLEARLNA